MIKKRGKKGSLWSDEAGYWILAIIVLIVVASIAAFFLITRWPSISQYIKDALGFR